MLDSGTFSILKAKQKTQYFPNLAMDFTRDVRVLGGALHALVL